jgi:hypothetical protein
VHHSGKTSLTKFWATIALAGMTSFSASGVASPSDPTIAEMQWQRRVLIISTPRDDIPEFESQLRMLAQWRGGDDRDVTVVRIAGTSVTGSRETAQELRERYKLASNNFSVLLVGKDGHVALRSKTPLSGAQIEGVIDAMPMRKAGQRQGMARTPRRYILNMR